MDRHFSVKPTGVADCGECLQINRLTKSRRANRATFVAVQTGFRVKFALPRDASAQGQGRQGGVGRRGRLETQEAHEQRPVDDPRHALRRRNIRLYRGRF